MQLKTELYLRKKKRKVLVQRSELAFRETSFNFGRDIFRMHGLQMKVEIVKSRKAVHFIIFSIIVSRFFSVSWLLREIFLASFFCLGGII